MLFRDLPPGFRDLPPPARTFHRASAIGVLVAEVAKATVPLIKKASKAHGFTLNDFVMAALSQALNDYQKYKGQMSKEDPLVVVCASGPIGVPHRFGGRHRIVSHSATVSSWHCCMFLPFPE